MTAETPWSRSSRGLLSGKRLLIVGIGGLGCPLLLSLADSGASLILVDDDVVEASNLHRQILFEATDVGRDKLDAARAALLTRGVAANRIELVRSRFLPDNARELARGADLVLEGADNYATKFLAADSCRLEHRPVIHGAAIRFSATVYAVGAEGRPCYRCLFEDVPEGAQTSCAEAGVMGPVAGLAGALMGELCLEILMGSTSSMGQILSYDGLADSLRPLRVAPRTDCPLCGAHATICKIEETRYTSSGCAA